MDLFLCWLVGPVLLLAVAIGLSFGVELLSGLRAPWCVRPALGLAMMMVIAQFGVVADATAELAIPVVVGLGAFGLLMGWSARLTEGPLPGWAIAAGLGAYLVYGAPVLLSGDPTWAGYIKLDDSASWMGLADHAFEFGHRTDGFDPSTWEALIVINAGSGYPIGSFVPMVLMGEVTGQDIAWTMQPSMAVMAGALTLMLAEIARTLLRDPRAAAAIAFLGGQAAMLLGYSLWGGIKEVAAAGLLALAPLAAWLAIRQPEARRAWLVPGIVAAAFLTALGPLSGVWLVATMAPLLWVALRELGRARAIGLAWKTVATAFVATLPQLVTPNGFFDPFRSYLYESSELGNLPEPLSIQHVMGIWPSDDFRVDPDFETAVTILALVVAALGVYAAFTAIRDREPLLPAYALGGALAFAVVYAAGSPWIDGKGMAIVSPALLTAGLCGAVLLIRRTSHAIEGWAVAALAGGLILYTSFLFYQGAWLAPRDEHVELERIGERFDGEGPLLVTRGSIYGPRHFLRNSDAEHAQDLRRRQVFLRDGRATDDADYLDVDQIATSSLAPYRLLVMRRSPAASSPPGEFRLAYRGDYYEVWERVGTPVSGQALVERLPLGEPPQPFAVPDCAEVQALAEQAGADGTLLAAPAGEQSILALDGSSRPDDWAVEGTTFTPRDSGTLETSLSAPTAGDYLVWVGGAIHGELAVSAGGQAAPSIRRAINIGEYQPFGPFELDAGEQEITMTYDGGGIAPGSGADQAALGPVILQREADAELPRTRVAASQYEQLCGTPWDWIEAYG